MPAGIKANSDGSAAIQVGGTDVITLTSGGAATFVTSPTTVQAGTAAAPSITFSGDTNTGIYSPGADQVAIATGGSQRVTADASGNLNIVNGNLVIGTSGKGIDFSANSHAAGMTSELLAWYEEGTFTPAIASGGTSITYSTRTGHYTRIGRQVFFRLQIAITAATANGNALTISGLPFSSGQPGGGFFNYDNSSWVNSTSTNMPLIFIGSNSTTIEFYTTTGAQVVGTGLNALSTENFYITGQYLV